MMLTYCKLCNKDVRIPNPIPEDNKDPDGYIVCKKCYWVNYSEEKKKRDKRDLALDKILKEKWWIKIWSYFCK